MPRPGKFSYSADVPQWIRTELERAAVRYRLDTWTIDFAMASLDAEDGDAWVTMATTSVLAQYKKGVILIRHGLRRTAKNKRELRHELIHVLLSRIDHAFRQWLDTSGVKVTPQQQEMLNRLWADAEDEVVEHLLDVIEGA